MRWNIGFPDIFHMDLLYFGIDMNIKTGKKIIFSLYANSDAPTVKMQFDNLFQDG